MSLVFGWLRVADVLARSDLTLQCLLYWCGSPLGDDHLHQTDLAAGLDTHIWRASLLLRQQDAFANHVLGAKNTEG